MEKIKVCFVKFNVEKNKKTYMFEMPWDSFLDEGDTVIVPDVGDVPREAIVIDTERYQRKYDHEWEDFERLLAVAGVELPLKRVLGKVERTYYEWEGTDNADED